VTRRALLVVTDLDGTLLDEATYTHEPAQPALGALRRRGARLVCATSKTAREVALLVAQLDLPVAAIVENGGAVLLPAGFSEAQGGDAVRMPLGVTRPVLVEALRAIAAETGLRLQGFADLDAERVAELTGLPLAQAALALDREYDEPFLLADETRLGAVVAAAAARGLVVTRGGRFHHLIGRSDKGAALDVLLGRLHASEGDRPETIGLGDAANDLPFLQRVDHAVIVPRAWGRPDGTLAAALPRAAMAPFPGPAGWNAAVLELLRAIDGAAPTAS
jgi:mannosyl-3-phosphoglycerate phosphatase